MAGAFNRVHSHSTSLTIKNRLKCATRWRVVK
jgi:hypothetical protein